MPEKPNFFKTKSKNAQEAHEAIRPTSSCLLPAGLKKKLENDQYRLYELVWKRAMASFQGMPSTLLACVCALRSIHSTACAGATLR